MQKIILSSLHLFILSFTLLFLISFLVADTRLYTLPCRLVRRSVRHISEFRSIFAVLLLPNRPRLDCRVPDLVPFLLRLLRLTMLNPRYSVTSYLQADQLPVFHSGAHACALHETVWGDGLMPESQKASSTTNIESDRKQRNCVS